MFTTQVHEHWNLAPRKKGERSVDDAGSWKSERKLLNRTAEDGPHVLLVVREERIGAAQRRGRQSEPGEFLLVRYNHAKRPMRNVSVAATEQEVQWRRQRGRQEGESATQNEDERRRWRRNGMRYKLEKRDPWYNVWYYPLSQLHTARTYTGHSMGGICNTIRITIKNMLQRNPYALPTNSR
ncbi:hypothetical protein PAAG_11885 [Paracoccidioides lutzii Pb01]|uniref:Uncharacterized protein n=1 Tax=Paracoccidioides lutzii (strain ATCC MYA-826 / Pb01) TaxID=502779 RepID=A0A0A2V0S8_PARBA|nr:hypothetical protein PAAG_11885 [Paracoccidioides lutzii Pb01]KGQ01421.1 hypothetical protein PAAG_11885 [Paracoccidioides lutzii Pb01]